jgi:hypothetical protein
MNVNFVVWKAIMDNWGNWRLESLNKGDLRTDGAEELGLEATF